MLTFCQRLSGAELPGAFPGLTQAKHCISRPQSVCQDGPIPDSPGWQCSKHHCPHSTACGPRASQLCSACLSAYGKAVERSGI